PPCVRVGTLKLRVRWLPSRGGRCRRGRCRRGRKRARRALERIPSTSCARTNSQESTTVIFAGAQSELAKQTSLNELAEISLAMPRDFRQFRSVRNKYLTCWEGDSSQALATCTSDWIAQLKGDASADLRSRFNAEYMPAQGCGLGAALFRAFDFRGLEATLRTDQQSQVACG
ncbi:MAG: hypothetical protein ACI9X4_001114, partial [Glaciecola sp.]